MKLTDVPESFRSQFILTHSRINESPLYISPSVEDCNGHDFPRGPLKLKGVYAGDIVKLMAGNGECFIVRMAEVLTMQGGEIVHEYLVEEFRKEMEPALSAKDLATAAMLMELPAVAVHSKLRKAQRLGFPVPSWFNK